MKKISVLLVVLLLFAAVFTGCTQSENESDKTEYNLKLYYVRQAYIETGDETEGVLYLYDKVLSCKEGQQYQAVVDLLQEIPEELEDVDTAVKEEIKYNSVYVEKGTAYVDIKSGEVTGGSLEETLYISQIVQSLLASFSEIYQVQFLIDGEVTETIMGHCDITEPYAEGIFTSVQ